jgi:hypothetical protein
MTTDDTPITSVWSNFGHTFISEGDGYESCLTCGAQFILRPLAGDPSRGEYVTYNGDEPTACTHITSMEHGWEASQLHDCNCIICQS